MSHSGQPEYSYEKDYPEWWDWWVRHMAVMHAKWFEILLKHCKTEKRCPIYVTRYEDLCSQPKEELTGIYKFLLEVDDLAGTNAERRLD